jgi:hypothetical protein
LTSNGLACRYFNQTDLECYEYGGIFQVHPKAWLFPPYHYADPDRYSTGDHPPKPLL